MSGHSGTGIPASIAAAWGVSSRPGRGPRPGLSLERIVAAAISVAESDGLAAVSMNRVATELGTSTMSLYRYVSAKDELLALMMDAPFPDPPQPRGPNEDWRTAVGRWARAEHEALRRHPWVVRIPRSGPPITPNQVAWLESGLSCLRDTGLTEGEKLSTTLLISGFVWNQNLLVADLTEAARAAGPQAPSAGELYGQVLTELTDPQRFPALHAMMAAGVFAEPDDTNLDTEFEFGLARLLDGIEALVLSRAAPQPTG